MGKLAQAMMHGAIILQIRGNFDDGMRLVKEVAEEAPVNIVNSIIFKLFFIKIVFWSILILYIYFKKL